MNRALNPSRHSDSREFLECPFRKDGLLLNGPERLVGMGFRCWIAGYQTGDISWWERGWNQFVRELGPEQAKVAVTELTGWARAISSNAQRDIRVCPFGERQFCRDECVAISLIAACQNDACPALEACAMALLGSGPAEPVMETSTRFARALDSVQLRLGGEIICSRHTASP